MRIAALSVAVALAGCAAAPSPAEAPRAPASEAVRDVAAPAPETPAAPAPAAARTPAVKPKTVAELVGDKLAGEWCMRGGTGFGPFGSENALPSCSSIRVRVEDAAKSGDVESAVIVLEPAESFAEEERYLLLQRGEEVAVFFLAHGFSSGIGGFSHAIEVHKLESKHAWAAKIESGWHDADMGICAETGSVAEDVVVCTHGAEGFGCTQVPITRSDYDWSTKTKNGACGETKTKDLRTGYAMTAKIDGDSLEVRTRKGASFTHATPPPFAGRSPISRLVRQMPARRVPLRG